MPLILHTDHLPPDPPAFVETLRKEYNCFPWGVILIPEALGEHSVTFPPLDSDELARIGCPKLKDESDKK